MKNLKFLFAALVLALFVGITQTNAQAVVQHPPLDGFSYVLDGQTVDFELSSARVITGIGTINSVWWGVLPEPENYDGPKIVVVDAGTHPIYGDIIWKFIVKEDGRVQLIAQTKKKGKKDD